MRSLEEEKLDQNSDKDSQSGEQEYDPTQINLKNLNRFWNESDVLKLIRKMQGEDYNFEIQHILKQRNKTQGYIMFKDPETKVQFQNHLMQSPLTKKIKYRLKSIPPSNYKSQGKSIKVVAKDLEKSLSHHIPTEQEMKQELERTLEMRMFNLYKYTYEKQIDIKKENFQNMLQKWGKLARDDMKSLSQTLHPEWLKGNQNPCELKEFVHCDEENRMNYRNKAEFTIGKDQDGIIRVGFNRGNFQKGIHLVERASANILTSLESIVISEKMEEFINSEQNKHPFYDKFTNLGVWRYLVIILNKVRQSFKTKQILINLVICDSSLEDKEEISEIMKKIFVDDLKLKINGYDIVSLGIQRYNDPGDAIPMDGQIELIHGSDYFTEEILGKKFQVSCHSFLQVNTPQCDKLYSLVGDM